MRGQSTGALIWLGLGLAMLGCEEPTPVREGPRGPPARAASPASRPPAPRVGAFAQREREPRPRASAGRGTHPSPRPAASTVAGDDLEATRDDPREALERALVEAFGDPGRCLSDAARDSAGETLRIRIQVRVTASGRPVRASVQSGGLPEADLECLTRRAEAVRLPAPIPDAPRTIQASVEYAVEDTRTSRTERTLPGRGLHPGTLRADRTLTPAGTETRRPTGFVRPSRTLPATAEPAQAPGYVPPAHALPARGGPAPTP